MEAKQVFVTFGGGTQVSAILCVVWRAYLNHEERFLSLNGKLTWMDFETTWPSHFLHSHSFIRINLLSFKTSKSAAR